MYDNHKISFILFFIALSLESAREHCFTNIEPIKNYLGNTITVIISINQNRNNQLKEIIFTCHSHCKLRYPIHGSFKWEIIFYSENFNFYLHKRYSFCASNCQGG